MGERICDTYGKGFIGCLNKGLLQINKKKRIKQQQNSRERGQGYEKAI